MTGRLTVAVVGIAVLVGTMGWALTLGPLRGCGPVAPRELPSGAPPGAGVAGVSGGALEVGWGRGPDRIEQDVDLNYFDESSTFLASAQVRGHAATLFRMDPHSGDRDVAMSWAEDVCDYTVFFAPGTSLQQAAGYASRY